MLAKRDLLKIRTYKPGKPIEELKRELGLKRVIKLASNENGLPPSPRVLSALAKSLKGLNRYPDSGSFYLKKALSGRLRLRPENFIIGNGSDEIISFATRAFVSRNDEVIIAKPTFLVYGIASAIAGARVRYVPLKGYRYDLEAMKKAVTKKTKLIFIANPDNPTGTYVTEGEIGEFLRGIREDVMLFFDEAYYEFARGARGYPDTLKLLKKRRNIIITRSFSKIYSLAGLRIGYGIADKRLIEWMSRVREPFNVNSLAQKAALAALGDGAFISKTKRLAEDGKRFLYNQFDIMRIEYIPSVTNFILFKLKDAPKVYKRLLKKGIIIRDMTAWGLDGFLRVTVGTMKENRAFAEALKGVL